MRAIAPSCGRFRVSYAMSDSMSCIRRSKENGSANRSDKPASIFSKTEWPRLASFLDELPNDDLIHRFTVISKHSHVLQRAHMNKIRAAGESWAPSAKPRAVFPHSKLEGRYKRHDTTQRQRIRRRPGRRRNMGRDDPLEPSPARLLHRPRRVASMRHHRRGSALFGRAAPADCCSGG